MSRRIVTWDEQDAYTRWRKVMNWHPGERKGIKRRTHQRERREARAGEVAELNDLLQPDLFLPFTDKSDCQHGCNGDCENWGGEGRCDFTCHDYRCENCTVQLIRPGAQNWTDKGWFCSPECYGEY